MRDEVVGESEAYVRAAAQSEAPDRHDLRSFADIVMWADCCDVRQGGCSRCIWNEA
jgi:hypothetical protein